MGLSSQKMNLDYIRTFVILGQSKNMTEASNKLNVNVSNVSRHISQLENELQTTLFIPTLKNRDLQLTENGKFFFERYEKIYNEILLAEKEFRQSKQIDNCKITIGVNNALEEKFLKPKLMQFSKKYPHLNIKVVNGDYATLSTKLNQYALDMVINDAICESRSKLQSIENILISSSNYCLLYNKKFFNDLSDLSKIPFILPINNSDIINAFNDYINDKKIKSNVKYQVESLDRILSYVKEGLGIAFTLKDSVELNQEVSCIDLDLNCNVYLSYIKGKLTPTTIEFIKLFNTNEGE